MTHTRVCNSCGEVLEKDSKEAVTSALAAHKRWEHADDAQNGGSSDESPEDDSKNDDKVRLRDVGDSWEQYEGNRDKHSPPPERQRMSVTNGKLEEKDPEDVGLSPTGER